jgi:hypothetical protein
MVEISSSSQLYSRLATESLHIITLLKCLISFTFNALYKLRLSPTSVLALQHKSSLPERYITVDMKTYAPLSEFHYLHRRLLDTPPSLLFLPCNRNSMHLSLLTAFSPSIIIPPPKNRHKITILRDFISKIKALDSWTTILHSNI